MSNLDQLIKLIPEEVMPQSGSVFYSGVRAFSKKSAVYVLGLNPGGSPQKQAADTIARHIEEIYRPDRLEWSAYLDESWLGKSPGKHGLQPRMLHIFQVLGLNPRLVPSSNLIFVRSSRESNLSDTANELAEAFWPFHEHVIRSLCVRMVICLGHTCGLITRNRLDAHERIDTFVEKNDRRWQSNLHRSQNGIFVATLTHPSVAAWNVAATDPTQMLKPHFLLVADDAT